MAMLIIAVTIQNSFDHQKTGTIVKNFTLDDSRYEN